MPAGVELFDDLDAVARDAAGALDRSAQPSLFDRLDWYRLTLAHCPPGGAPLVLRARADDAAAWLFLMREGAAAHALTSWYSLGYDASIAGDAAAAPSLLCAMASCLKHLRPKLATVLLAPLAPDSPLPAAFRAAGWHVRSEAATVNWYAQTEGLDFDSYWAARPGKLRSTVKRKAKTAGLDIRIVRHFDDDIWRGYWDVYRASWKPEEGSPAFLEALARQEGAAGTLRMGLATRQGRPVAAQLWLVENGVATIHKLAYVDAERAYSPGTLLSAAMFRHVIDEDRPRLIDFGTGDDSYKADWMDGKRALLRLDAWNPASLRGWRGAGRAMASALVRRLRSD